MSSILAVALGSTLVALLAFIATPRPQVIHVERSPIIDVPYGALKEERRLLRSD